MKAKFFHNKKNGLIVDSDIDVSLPHFCHKNKYINKLLELSK